MKKFFKKYAWPLVILLVVCLLFGLWISSRSDWKSDYKTREYTTFCPYDNGFSCFYEALELAAERNAMSADVFCKSARFLPDRSMAVISLTAGGGYFAPEERAELDKALEEGLVLAFLEPTASEPDSVLGIPPEDAEERSIGEHFVIITEVGKGCTVRVRAEEQLTNGSLKFSTDAGAEVLAFLINFAGERNCKTILYDEYYAGIRRSEMEDILGSWLVFGLIELALAVIAFLLWKSKRFGAPKELPEVERRSETEGLEATARLYRTAGAGSIGFCIHAEEVLYDLGKIYALPGHWDAEEIAAELELGKACADRDVIALAHAYQVAVKNEISEARARQCIALADRIRKKIKEDMR